MENERAYWMAWSTLYGVGPILLKRLEKQFGSLAIAWQATAAELLEVEGLGLLTADAIAAARRQIDPLELLHQQEQTNPYFWTPADADYPQLLLEIPDPPPVLYYRGQVNRDELRGLAPMVAIVGTRSPSEYGRRWTRRLAERLIHHGFTIVSGLAEGIDTEAHRRCVGLGGRTIAVLGCGADVIYPWSNRTLYDQILESGLVLSEHPAGTKPDRMFFPRRNRIIAGLCRATVLIEAGEKSGGLITTHYANEYGREVYVLPGSLDNPKAIGCLKLINKGAQVIVDEAEFIEMLGLLPTLTPAIAPPTPAPLPTDLDPDWVLILQALTTLAQSNDGEPVPLDRLAQSTNLPASTLSSALFQLEMAGFVTPHPGMRYLRS